MHKRVSGVTLIETMVAVAIMAVLLGVVVPSMARMLERQRVQGVAEQAALDLHQARSEALSRQESVFVSTAITGGGSCYVLSIGSKDGCSCTADGKASCDIDSTPLKTVGFAPGYPVQLLGAPANGVTIDSMRAIAVSTGKYTFGSTSGLSMRLVVSGRSARLCEVGKPDCP
jgi:prepilin-type N-terminal cleavage/methylation domain-containing protein